jgi:hypothetical protein
MAKTNNPWHIAPGINNVGSFQVSGEPFATASINATAPLGTLVAFPQVTKWVQIHNYDTGILQVGFSSNGVRGNPYDGYGGKNYFNVPASGSDAGPGSSGILELKVSEIWLLGSANVNVVAGLTSIPAHRTAGTAGTSWSGSSGVG